tara:strand:+ start:1511 stop:2041 length:531 start_codon:yes stop_codon:yes gene_type:complete
MMYRKEIHTIQGYVNAEGQECNSFEECTIVMTTAEDCGLAYPMTKSEFENLPQPEIGMKFLREVKITHAPVVELADTHDLGSCAERRTGSSPVRGTLADRVCKVLEGMYLLDMHEIPGNNFANKVYMWCHIARGECKNSHDPWFEDFLEAEKAIHKALMSPAEREQHEHKTSDTSE